MTEELTLSDFQRVYGRFWGTIWLVLVYLAMPAAVLTLVDMVFFHQQEPLATFLFSFVVVSIPLNLLGWGLYLGFLLVRGMIRFARNVQVTAELGRTLLEDQAARQQAEPTRVVPGP